jgi:hypothetical protein
MKEKAIGVIDRNDVLVRSRLPLWRVISKATSLGTRSRRCAAVASGNLLSLADEVIESR